MRVATARPDRPLILVGLAMLADCATGPPIPVSLTGTSGSISWEITDVGQLQSRDGRRTRWSYVILLKAPAGEGLRLEHVQRGISSLGEMIGSPQTIPYEQALVGNSVLRFPDEVDWGWVGPDTPFGGSAALPPANAEYRFVGHRGPAERVTIVVRTRLDRSVGLPAAKPPIPDSLPPARSVDDLAGLVGTWRGYVRDDGGVFDVPLEIRVNAAGIAEVGLNTPITRRFRANVLVSEGQVRYGAGSDSGTLTLHEQEGERILAGPVSSPRQSPQAPLGYTVRLRWEAP
jgi:hypothetical protein